jgi:hypothetical protein
MTINLPKEKWLQFFDDLNKRRFGWSTKIEVMNDSIGDQVLSEGLPFNGIVLNNNTIQIAVGNEAKQHQTHNISNPTKVAFLYENEKGGGIVEIEEENGTKTLIHILEPMSVIISYSEYEITST